MEVVKKIKITDKKIHPPFGYFGSKNKIAFKICESLPPHNCWVEAFCGSAALTLRKTHAPIEVINDIDNDIINLFEQLRNHPEKLCRLIELTPYAEEELAIARNGNGKISGLERARRFLVQSMMAINGVFGKERGGFSYSDSYSRNGHDARVNRWNNLPDRIAHVVERLKEVRIENKDARTLMRRYMYRPATLIYLDPPYFAHRSNGYNKDTIDLKFHMELLEIANKSNCMILISGYKNDLYDVYLTPELGWSKKQIKTNTKDSEGNSHSRTEILWMNKYYIQAQGKNSINIKLSKREDKQKKLNPERKYFKL